MKTITYFLLASILLITSCASNNTVRYTIASQQGDCTGVAPQKCMLVKKGDATEWEYFYSQIEGFNYTEGYEYVIDVIEENLDNVPADASSIKYTMAKEVSKTEKVSEGMPISNSVSEGYECSGKVLAIEKADIGRGGAKDKFQATVVQIKVTSAVNDDIKQGDTIFCELVENPNVMPEVGREYVFKAKHNHPAHAKGIYLLETNALDLTR